MRFTGFAATFLFSVVVTFLAPTAAQNESAVDGLGLQDTEPKNTLNAQEVLKRVLGNIEALTTMKSSFTQIAPSGAVTTGTLFLRRPGQARFEYDDPSPILIVATQGNVYVEDKSLDQTDSYPIGKTPLRYLLDREINIDGLEVLDFENSDEQVAITLHSRDEDTAGAITLIASLPDYSLIAWSILDSQNGITIVELTNTELGGKIPNRAFRAPEAGGSFINN